MSYSLSSSLVSVDYGSYEVLYTILARGTKDQNTGAYLLFSVTTCLYSLPLVDGIWGIWASYCNILKAIIYLLQRDYNPLSNPNFHFMFCFLRRSI